MAEESISVFDFLPELLGVLIGTVIGYLIASRTSKLSFKKKIRLTKESLIEEVEHNKKALKSWRERGTSFQHHISTASIGAPVRRCRPVREAPKHVF